MVLATVLTQPQILSLLSLALYLVFVCIIYQGAKKYKEWRFIQEVMELVEGQAERIESDFKILYLTCHNPNFKQLNSAVSEFAGKMAIVLEGPDWFVHKKKVCWRKHHVIAAEQLSQVPIHFRDAMRLYCKRTGKWLGAEEAVQDLQQISSSLDENSG